MHSIDSFTGKVHWWLWHHSEDRWWQKLLPYPPNYALVTITREALRVLVNNPTFEKMAKFQKQTHQGENPSA